jgi:8-amino-7-oxononanoate synthase
MVDGKELLVFCSNDYLGLARHPVVAEAFKKGIDRYGSGSGAAHLISGHSPAHHALEEELAEFVQRPAALLFSTGYMANLGIIAALCGRNDTLFEDRLNHASLLDAATLSRARLIRYSHGQTDELLQKLAGVVKGRKLVVTDGVFSMDGDLAPLPTLAGLTKEHQAWLMVDDAHGFGVLGPQGRGTLAHFGLGLSEVPVLMATLGKGLGVFGAFVAGSEELIETLVQFARPYIYTTATPAAMAEATRTALSLVGAESWRRERLLELIRRFRVGAAQLGLPLMESSTPIQPLLLGCAERALRWSQGLESAGMLVSAIRPPTVPEGMARLRITLTAAHQDEDIDRLLDSLGQILAGDL